MERDGVEGGEKEKLVGFRKGKEREKGVRERGNGNDGRERKKR